MERPTYDQVEAAILGYVKPPVPPEQNIWPYLAVLNRVRALYGLPVYLAPTSQEHGMGSELANILRGIGL